MKKGVLAAAAALAVGAAFLGPRLWHPAATAVAADAPAPATPAPGVPVVPGTVTAGYAPVLLNAIGTVQAYNMVTIKSRVDGQIKGVKFEEGQNVDAGTP